jgi:sulfite reductase (ferredoxin)
MSANSHITSNGHANGKPTGRPAQRRLPENPSKVEHQKADSNYLRGSIEETLKDHEASEFKDEDLNLLKVHGIYQQYDRDHRVPKSQREHTLMVRARIPGGILSAEQYLNMDQLAREYGGDRMRLTTRQSIQYHGVVKGDIRVLLRGLNAKLVSTLAACGDVMRNVMCCPAIANDPARQRLQEIAHDIAISLAPQSTAYHDIWLDGERIEQGHQLLNGTAGQNGCAAKNRSTEHSDEFEVEPLYGKLYLPRKFKMGIALQDDNCIDAYTQDCALIAIVDEETRNVKCLNLLVGGGLGMTHRKKDTFARLATVIGSIDPEHAVDAVRIVIEIFRDFGNREDRRHARLKYTIEEFGLDWFIDEFKRRANFDLRPPIRHAVIGYKDHLGWQEQGDGLWSFGLFIENGRLRDTDGENRISAVREVVERLRPGVRITPQQNLLFTHIAPDDRDTLIQILREHSVPLNEDVTRVRRNSMACPALPTCGLALADAERALPDVISSIEPIFDELGITEEDIGVRMTGCPNGCARPYNADIAFVGRSPGVYDVYCGGRLAGDRLVDVIGEKINQDEIPELLRPILEQYAEEREPGEGLGDWWQRISGRTEPKTLLTGAKDIYNPTLRGEPMG